MGEHIVVIDPAVKRAETDCFNRILEMSSLPCTYHLPVMSGSDTFDREDVALVKAVIILGGSGNLEEPLSWREDLENWFTKCLDAKVPTLGICWGHQWIATLFGGEIGFAREDQEKYRGFREIQVEKRKAFKESAGQVVVSHRSMVVKAPAKTNVFVKSAELENEGFEYEDYPIYTFQAHPEATPSFLIGNEIPRDKNVSLDYGNGLVKEFIDWAQAR